MTNRRRGWQLVPAAGAVLAMFLTACSSSGTSTGNAVSSQGGGQSSSPTSPAKQSIDDLVDAAKKEGSVTWYTATSDKDTGPVIAEFGKTYPGIKVKTLRLSADKLAAKVLTEQQGGNFNADVVSGNAAYVAQLINAGALQPYDTPDALPLPAGLDLPKGYQGVTYIQSIVIAYNPTVAKEKGLAPPTSWEDLTKPEWKGHFSVNPSDVDWYNSMVVTMGHDKALELAKALGNNSPMLVESHSQALTQVESGEPIATAMTYGHDADDAQKKNPDNVTFANTNPLPSSLNLIDLAKNAPHPNAARVFLDWMESKAGQQSVIDASGYISIRDDVNNIAAVWDPAQWKPAWSPPTMDPATFNQRAQELKDAFRSK